MTDVLHFTCDMSTADRDQMIGPDFGRRYLAVRSVDGSTVTLRGVLPNEYRQRVTAIAESERIKARIRKLFNA